MRLIVPLLFIIAITIASGCTSYLSNLTTPNTPLTPDQGAEFEGDGNHFIISIDHIEAVRAGSDIRNVKVDFTVVNEGKEPKDAFTLIAYPTLTDSLGNSYTTKSIFFGTVNPGHPVTGKTDISIASKDPSPLYQNSSVLSLKFQTLRPLSYAANWKIDLKNYTS